MAWFVRSDEIYLINTKRKDYQKLYFKDNQSHIFTDVSKFCKTLHETHTTVRLKECLTADYNFAVSSSFMVLDYWPASKLMKTLWYGKNIWPFYMINVFGQLLLSFVFGQVFITWPRLHNLKFCEYQLYPSIVTRSVNADGILRRMFFSSSILTSVGIISHQHAALIISLLWVTPRLLSGFSTWPPPLIDRCTVNGERLQIFVRLQHVAGDWGVRRSGQKVNVCAPQPGSVSDQTFCKWGCVYEFSTAGIVVPRLFYTFDCCLLVCQYML